jgi:Brp/Blh family beta-carotene 15,15'-monooxygenase
MMILVLMGWWAVPLLTIFLFVILSALHFGLGETHSDSLQEMVRSALSGSMVVWVPALFQPVEFTQLLLWVVPDGKWPESVLFHPIVRGFLGSLLTLVVVMAFLASPVVGLRTVGFLILFALAPPLISFIVYFCGWHSVTELMRLAQQADPKDPWAGLGRVFLEAAPLSLLAVGFIALGWWMWASEQALTPGLIQTVFIGLSIVAVPHILLHWIATKWNINPYLEVGQ